MKCIKNYKLQKPLIIDFNVDSVGFQEAEREIDGEEFEILWIKKTDSNKSIIERVFKNIKAVLLDFQIVGIQKIIEIDEDENCSFIVYESIKHDDAPEFNKQDLEQIIATLDALKKVNLKGFLLDEKTIVKTCDNKIKIRFIGLFHLFSKKIIPYGDIGDDKKSMEDDLVAVSKIFERYLSDSGKRQDIHNKCQSKKYTKYSELIDDIHLLPNEKNLDWPSMPVTYNKEKLDTKGINIDDLFGELNSGCWWDINDQLTKKGDVQVKWSTRNMSGNFYVEVKDTQSGSSDGRLFVDLHITEKAINSHQWERAEFNFIDGMYKIKFCPLPDFLTKPFVNKLAKNNQNKKDSLETWKALPENEKKYIEKQAFRASYTNINWAEGNETKIVFKLKEAPYDWEKIKKKKNDGVILSIDGIDIGKILDYKQKEKIIVIKDHKTLRIPKEGELVEDVRQSTSQYKKQIEACQKFSNGDVANPEIAAFICTPDEIPLSKNLEIDYDYFEDKIINQDLKNDETQKSAVIEALHRKPLYLIQGPPGTGKTTVIVEMIKQFINKKKDAKILIVSQSNTAVDNVLERINSKEIKFIRLVSENAKEKISSEIKKHTFDTKLDGWVKETEKRSKKNFDKEFSDIDSPLKELYKSFEKNKSKISIEDFRKEYQKSRMWRNYYEKIFQKAQNIEQVKEIFNKKLGSEYIKLQPIHSDWLAFVRRANSKKGNQSISKIKHGSEDIGLDVAFVKSMNVFGSTCIHIASGNYSSIDLKFDEMIMDESSKATEAEALVPIGMSKNIILIGDHKQLPPVVTREDAVKKGIKEDLEDNGLDIDKTYGKSMFERLITSFESKDQYANLFTMLNIQYRMPRQIGSLISKFIYDGELENPPLDNYDETKAHNILFKTPTVNIKEEQVPNSIIVISTSEHKKPYDNNNKDKRNNSTNIKVIQNTLEQINILCKNDDKIPTEIGIIAAYSGQVELLKSSITKNNYKKLKIDINTVDQFQGSEKDIIIYDVVRSNSGPSSIGFLDDYRRINVAFSRAKKLLLVVGDSNYVLNKVQCNPNSNIEDREDLHLVKIFKQLKDWGCIYPSFEEALNYDR